MYGCSTLLVAEVVPLKQGLKHYDANDMDINGIVAEVVPLKQGLKRTFMKL